MNYERILGISPSATIAQIKTAYRRVAAANHPDLALKQNNCKNLQNGVITFTLS